jgi:hypothetical protein
MDSLHKNEWQSLIVQGMFMHYPTRAPWGDITRVARLLGRAKGNGSRINAHKVEPFLSREEGSFA